ncbi:hypothetical protein GSI_14605 [Ganoderma sinense ZZ0214-1]|uniref:F-box domain-containing protein n=1 Tax=Ganoderma sinense ZZ0214-1 TaxID=1077348 RepID=A0A2G8RP47_9APHY|nr:hypothetical protein GSI_14605 [Ganoderma sinense ZZ0214-1]
MIKPTSHLLDSTRSPPPGIASQPKSGGGKEPAVTGGGVLQLLIPSWHWKTSALIPTGVEDKDEELMMTSAGQSESAEWSRTAVQRPVPSLPEDIIAQVCDAIFATPLYEYDLSRTLPGLPSSYSNDLDFLQGIPLVSKIWWKPATRCLYEHIIIRQVGQIPLLVRTLTSKDAGIDFGTLVRRITLYECVVYPDSDGLDEDVRTIFERCVVIEELSFQRHPDCEDVIEEGDRVVVSEYGANPVWIFPQIIFPTMAARSPTMLCKLDLVSLNCRRWKEKAITALYNLLLASPRITALTIQNVEIPIGLVPPVLEYLKELTLLLQHSTSPSPPFPHDVWTWGLPNLRSLTLLNGFKIPTTILEKLGRTLTYLYLCYPIVCEDLQPALLSRLCPVLEHLVLYLHPFTLERVSATFRSASESGAPFRRLHYLDMWLTGDAYRRYRTVWGASDAAAFVASARSTFAPALVGVRALPALSLSSLPALADLPNICHPSALERTDDTRVVCVYDIPMLQTTWCVRPAEDWWLNR